MKPETQTTLSSQLEKKLAGITADLIAQNISLITEELTGNPDGKISVSVGLKVVNCGKTVTIDGSIGFSRKFKDELQDTFAVEDPNQLPLPITPESDTEETPRVRAGVRAGGDE